jgi:hypothetical protein
MYFNKSTNIRICKLIMQETGSYNPQYLRPYTTNFDGPTVNNVVDRVISAGSGRIDPSVLSGITGSFISPSSQPEALIPISNGWNEKRIRFLMEVECDYQTGGTSKSYIQGYTNFPGISASHAIAPDMDFFINSIVTTKISIEHNMYGSVMRETVADNSHVLSSNSWMGVTQPGQQQLLRPQDIFCYMQTSHLPGAFDSDQRNVLDVRTILRNDATKSSRTNGLASNYAAKIIDGYVVGATLSDYSQAEMTILDRSRSEVNELRASEDPFLMALSSINVSANGTVNHFRYSDLMKLDPNVDNVSNFVMMGATQKATIHSAGQTSQWHGSDLTTVTATVLSQSVPALMMELMLSRLVFKSTNHDIQGRINTVIIDAGGFANTELTTMLNMFKIRFITEILNNLTNNNHMSYMLEMRIDLLGETWIDLSIDNNPSVTFVTPSFCDNLFVPVVTSNPATIENLTNDFSGLVFNIREGMQGSSNGGLNLSSKV